MHLGTPGHSNRISCWLVQREQGILISFFSSVDKQGGAMTFSVTSYYPSSRTNKVVEKRYKIQIALSVSVVSKTMEGKDSLICRLTHSRK